MFFVTLFVCEAVFLFICFLMLGQVDLSTPSAIPEMIRGKLKERALLAAREKQEPWQ